MVNHTSCIFSRVGKIQIRSNEYLPFCFSRFALARTQYRTWNFFRLALNLFSCFRPFLLTLQNLLQVVLRFLTYWLFLPTYFGDFFSKFKSFRDHLSQSLFMEFCLFSKFKIVVGDSLFKNTWNLLEDFWKILLKLWSKSFKELLYFKFYLFSVYFLQILIYLSINSIYQLL